MPSLPVLVFYGAHRSLEGFSSHILLTSYGTLRSGKSPLTSIAFDIAIYDEVQVAKNSSSQTHKALVQIDAAVRIGLTGTPVENNLFELKSLFDVVLPTYMPTETLYKEFFVHPIEKQHDGDKQNLLARFIHPFILRRKKSEVLLELPEKVESIAYAPLSDEQKKLYTKVVADSKERLLKELQNGDKPVPYIHIFSLLTKLKQICDHPALYLDKEAEYKHHSSGKWDYFIELLSEILASGQKLVVFSQFLGMLDIIESYLKEKGITFATIRGSTKIDLGGIGKGLAADRSSRSSSPPAPTACCVNLGGDVRVAPGATWRRRGRSSSTTRSRPVRVRLRSSSRAAGGDRARACVGALATARRGSRRHHLRRPVAGATGLDRASRRSPCCRRSAAWAEVLAEGRVRRRTPRRGRGCCRGPWGHGTARAATTAAIEELARARGLPPLSQHALVVHDPRERVSWRGRSLLAAVAWGLLLVDPHRSGGRARRGRSTSTASSAGSRSCSSRCTSSGCCSTSLVGFSLTDPARADRVALVVTGAAAFGVVAADPARSRSRSTSLLMRRLPRPRPRIRSTCSASSRSGSSPCARSPPAPTRPARSSSPSVSSRRPWSPRSASSACSTSRSTAAVQPCARRCRTPVAPGSRHGRRAGRPARDRVRGPPLRGRHRRRTRAAAATPPRAPLVPAPRSRGGSRPGRGGARPRTGTRAGVATIGVTS